MGRGSACTPAAAAPTIVPSPRRCRGSENWPTFLSAGVLSQHHCRDRRGTLPCVPCAPKARPCGPPGVGEPTSVAEAPERGVSPTVVLAGHCHGSRLGSEQECHWACSLAQDRPCPQLPPSGWRPGEAGLVHNPPRTRLLPWLGPGSRSRGRPPIPSLFGICWSDLFDLDPTRLPGWAQPGPGGANSTLLMPALSRRANAASRT